MLGFPGSSSGDYLFLGNNKVWQGADAMHDYPMNNRIFNHAGKGLSLKFPAYP
jgi:hypothetical protein